MMNPALASMISSCCDAFRLGREAEASELFDQVLIEITSVIESNPAMLTDAMQRSFALALRCQQRRDWIGLADEIEYVIAERLLLRCN